MASVVTKINMPLEYYNKIGKKFAELNQKFPGNNQFDFEKYKYIKNYGKLLFHLQAVEIGARKSIEAPEYYSDPTKR